MRMGAPIFFIAICQKSAAETGTTKAMGPLVKKPKPIAMKNPHWPHKRFSWAN